MRVFLVRDKYGQLLRWNNELGRPNWVPGTELAAADCFMDNAEAQEMAEKVSGEVFVYVPGDVQEQSKFFANRTATQKKTPHPEPENVSSRYVYLRNLHARMADFLQYSRRHAYDLQEELTKAQAEKLRLATELSNAKDRLAAIPIQRTTVNEIIAAWQDAQTELKELRADNASLTAALVEASKLTSTVESLLATVQKKRAERAADKNKPAGSQDV